MKTLSVQSGLMSATNAILRKPTPSQQAPRPLRTHPDPHLPPADRSASVSSWTSQQHQQHQQGPVEAPSPGVYPQPQRAPPIVPVPVIVDHTELPAEHITSLRQLRRFEHPKELENVHPETAPEICTIVKDSIVEVRAAVDTDVLETASIRPESSMSGFPPMRVVEPGADAPEVVISRSPTIIRSGLPGHERAMSSISVVTSGANSFDWQASRLSTVSSKSSTTSSKAESAKLKAAERMSKPVYAVGPAAIAGMVTITGAPTERYQGERYMAPRLESPYAKKFKKMLASRKGAGECASCLDDMKNKNLTALDCQHKYCAPCFQKLINTAMADEHFFPPKCCLTEIPQPTVVSFLPLSQRSLYKSKAREYALPAAERWYCPYTHCGRWMDLGSRAPRNSYMDSYLKCPNCKEPVCIICRGEAHISGQDCPQDYGLEATLEESERNGWRRCFNCRAMVELGSGCRHITCKCRAEFCYVCGLKWLTCACSEADQARRQAQIETARVVLTAEEREVAAAIAAVEAEEERSRRDDEMRARIRAYEEEAERIAIAETARVIEEARVAEIRKVLGALALGLDSLHRFQRKKLDERHAAELQTATAAVEETDASLSERLHSESSKAGERSVLAVQNFAALQAHELEDFTARQEEEEDDYFLGIRAHLRGKPNREAREKAALEKIQKVQAEERDSLLLRQQAERDALVQKEAARMKGLEPRLARERTKDRDRAALRLEELKERHQVEVGWVRAVVEKRKEIVERETHRLIRSGGGVERYTKVGEGGGFFKRGSEENPGEMDGEQSVVVVVSEDAGRGQSEVGVGTAAAVVEAGGQGEEQRR